ncbi:hypothetical protein BDQ17DRAFT_1366691 [Cyathus striatus]|nr:hypothetical protein BDQ17DRAFT_1366691 [Cyathus striatus]
MSEMSTSERMLRIYDSLPPEAQHILLEKLVSEIPDDLKNQVLPTLTNVQSTYRRAPKLDIKLKSKEVQLLLDDLSRDAKRAHSRTNYTLTTSWLNDIWSSVVEHGVQYQLAHRCLLFIAEVCVKVGDHPGLGGRPPVLLQIHRLTSQSSKPIKNFSLRGLHSTPRALLWIWRALFLSLLTKGPKGEEGRITEMLQDMDDILGWRAVAAVAVGGEGYTEPLFLPNLTEHITTHLINLFSIAPSLALYDAIIDLTPSYHKRLMGILNTVAGSTADTYLAALEIWAQNDQFNKISDLLRSTATSSAHVTQVPSKGLYSTSSCPPLPHIGIRQWGNQARVRNLLCLTASLLRSTFPGLTTAEKQTDLQGILSDIMPSVDPVNGPGGMFAAMMMEDMLNFVELDERDADLAEVKERWRPKIAERKGARVAREVWRWIEGKDKEGEERDGGLGEKEKSALLLLKGNDIVDEMVERMNERGLKPHLAEALDLLSRFCKKQRTKSRQQKSSSSNAPAVSAPAGNPYTGPTLHFGTIGSGGLDDVD